MSIISKVDVGLRLMEDGYAIRVGESISETMGFGDGPLVYEAENGKMYIAHVDLPEGADTSSEVESLIGDGFVFEVKDTGAEVEEDEDGGGDDDGGEEVEVEVQDEEAA